MTSMATTWATPMRPRRRLVSFAVAAGFACLDLVLVGCYVYLAWLSVRCVQTTVDGAMAERKASQSATACSLV